MSIHNNSVNASEAAMAIDSPVLKVGIDPFSGASSDVSYSSALTEWILEKSNPPEMLFNSDSLVFGDERTFIVSSIVRPAVYRTGIIVVILPSIDSIRRYKRYLGSFDVRMASFDLAPTKAEKREIWEQLDDQEVDVILVSPGRLNSLRFRERLARRTIRHIVIGQAHLMSSWAHRFNPYYRQVGSFVRSQTSVRKVAHFWTADQKVYQDVSKCLGLINPAVSNANESVTLTPKLRGEVVKTAEERTQLINDFLLNHDCQGVIYAGSLKEIHDTKSMLAKRGEEPVVYRPGVDEFTLNRIREQFETGEIRIVIAQGPFLSTLEKSPGLEFVIFNGLPEALEFVGQELFAHETATPLACLCLASDRDFFHHRFVIDKSYPDSLNLRACFQAVKDAFGAHSFVTPELLRVHVKTATPLPEEEIDQCISVLMREGLLEYVVNSSTDEILIKLVDLTHMELNFWHEYPLRKLEQISRLEKTRDFLTTSGELGKSLRDVLKI